MPGAGQASQVRRFLPARPAQFFAGRDRDTALATARLIASSHFNIIEASHGRSDRNNEKSQFFSLQSKSLITSHQTQSVSLLETLCLQVSNWLNASFWFPCLASACHQRQLQMRWRPDGSGHVMGSSTPVRRPGGPADLVAHAVSPICTRPTSILQLWAEPNRCTEKASPARFPSPENTFSTPSASMMSVLERPRNASRRIGSESHGFFPRSYSGHCP